MTCDKFVPQPRPIKTNGDRKRCLRKLTKTLIFQGLSRSGVVLEEPNIGGGIASRNKPRLLCDCGWVQVAAGSLGKWFLANFETPKNLLFFTPVSPAVLAMSSIPDAAIEPGFNA